MSQGPGGAAGQPVAGQPVPARPVAGQPVQPQRGPRRRGLAGDLTLLAIVGVLLIAAVAAGAAALYRDFYSPTAFVERYLGMLAEGRAADALAVTGVAVDSTELEAAGLPASASDALLRRDALAALTEIEIVAEEPTADGPVRVTATYRAGAYAGTTTFQVQQTGTVGIAPTWGFAKSPLALLDLVVTGSMTFDVNGFTLDKRQVSPEGVDADPGAAMSLLVFSPGIYSVAVDTPISSTPGVAVLSDSPFANVPVDVEASATAKFVEVVQQEVEAFLTSCAAQEVLQPTACPFGYYVQDRIVSPPVWSISAQPTVSVLPEQGGWRIPDAPATAHIEVEIRSLFDGSVRRVVEDVPFIVQGMIEILPDGTASITVSGSS